MIYWGLPSECTCELFTIFWVIRKYKFLIEWLIDLLQGRIDEQSFEDKLAMPLANMAEAVAGSIFSDNVQIIGDGVSALCKAGKEIEVAFGFLRQAYIALEIKASKLEYSNYVLKRRAALSTGELFLFIYFNYLISSNFRDFYKFG